MANPVRLTPAEIAERAIPSVVRVVGARGHGSGFVVRPDGWVVTNLHVIDGEPEAKVVLADGREIADVRVMASSEDLDLCLLCIDASGLPVLELGDSALVHPGEPVVAIGHPLGFGNSVTDGLVSAIREVEAGVTMLQVSAPISPGSSGGPLINDRGQVVGLSTFVVARGQNLNFGTPVNYLKELIAAVPEGAEGRPLASFVESRPRPGLRRSVPRHELTLLEEASDTELEQVKEAIWGAINVGAPLYNQGNHEACFRIYEGLALDLERRLKGLQPIKQALLAGVSTAQQSKGYSQKAWDMRDAFDGILDVIDRRLGLSDGDDDDEDEEPAPHRSVPRHELDILASCSDEVAGRVAREIIAAIDVGAPLYNQGHAEACFLVYQGAALELCKHLGDDNGARRALQDGLERASREGTPEERAWAMRDTFDGLLDVIERRLASRRN
jgi:hypothetical protein